jgi:Domain of Unknown Function with PDB structure (DUF3857)
MIKYFTLFTTSFFLYSLAFSQKGQPAVGKINVDDLNLIECPYDKDAIAFKLIDWGSVHYARGTTEVFFKTVYQKRERIKILKNKGLKYANITVPYYSYNNAERIIKMEAYVYNLDENNTIKTISVNKASTYTKKINTYYSELIIPFPDVKVGSVIEYRYTLERETMGHIKDWYFQEEIPIRYSEYELKIPLVFKFGIQPSIVDSIEVKEDVAEELINTNQGVVKTNSLCKKFIMRNLKALPNEPYMGAAKDYQQRLSFQLSQIDYGQGDIKYLRNTWSDVLTNLKNDEDFGKQLENDFYASFNFIDELKSKSDNEQKLLVALSYFQKHFTWNKQEGIYSYKGVQETWESKTGSIGDINLLFIKLLKDAGVNISPILFSTRDNGTVNMYFPFIEQFNATLCYALIDGKSYVIDASNKYCNYRIIPEKINNCNGLIIDGNTGKWFMAKDSLNKYKVIVATRGNLDINGVMTGETVVNTVGYSKLNRIKKWEEDRGDFVETFFSGNGQAIQLNDLQVKNIDESNLPFEQKAKYTYTLGSSGSYKYFTTNFFTDFTQNQFLKDERVTDIDFGYLQDYLIYGSYTIPEGFVFEELPQNITFIMPDKSIVLSRFTEVNENNLSIRITIEFKKPYYSVSNYHEFSAFYKKMFDYLNEQIVIKKK